jgi:hypothetical protein
MWRISSQRWASWSTPVPISASTPSRMPDTD